MDAKIYNQNGKEAGSIALPEDIFGLPWNADLVHLVVIAMQANARTPVAHTKFRGEVSGTGKKPWKQKGTGRARQGSTRAPHWRGGGTVFGPQPRDYRTEIPRKVKQLARKSALNARAREGALHVVERFAFRRPKTAQLAALLDSLGLDGRKVLVLTANGDPNVYLSGRNLPAVDVMPYAQASAYDVLWSDAVVVEEGALTGVMPEPLPDEPEAEEAPAPRKRAGVAKAKVAKPKATKKATKAAKKRAPSRSEGAARKPAKKSATKAAKPGPSRSKGKPAPKKKGKK